MNRLRVIWLCSLPAAAATLAAAQSYPSAGAPTTCPTTQPADPNSAGSMRQLWKQSIQPPETAESARLRELMDELRRMRVAPVRHSKTPLAVSAVPEQPATAPASTQPAGPPRVEAEVRTAPVRTLPEQVIQQLKSIPAAGLSRPAELADELYRSGYLDAAFAIYELAMKQETDAETKAWALYQMANCRRTAAPDEAGKLYLRVTAEHAQTPWAAPAAIELKLLEWQRVNRPMELLGRIRQVGRPAAAAPTTQPQTAVTEGPTQRP